MMEIKNQSKYRHIWNSDKGFETYTKNDCEYASYLKNIENKFYEEHYSKSHDEEQPKSERTIPFSFDISKRREKFRDSYEEKMKDISQAILQEKQQERILKRREGDFIKKQYNLKKIRNHFDTEISTKKFEEDSRLAKEVEKFEDDTKKFYSEKARTARTRMFVSKNVHVDRMGKTRRSVVNISKLMREYDVKKKELDTNANDIVKMMEDYEKKLAREENKNRILQKELEEIAATLHMELLKLKTQEQELNDDKKKQKETKEEEDKDWQDRFTAFLNQNSDSVKIAEQERKNMDAELARMQTDHEFKNCAYGGSLNSIRHKLKVSEANQKSLVDQAEILKLLMKKSEKDCKIENVNAKRQSLLEQRTEMVANENRLRDEKSLQLLRDSQISMDAKNEADRCSHLKNTVRYDKEMEQKLFKQMNDASKDIKERSIEISKLKRNLESIQNDNSSMIYKQMKTANEEEAGLKLQIGKYETELNELKIKRDMHKTDLLSHRKVLVSDEKELEKSQTTQRRLENIVEKTESTDNVVKDTRYDSNKTSFPSIRGV